MYGGHDRALLPGSERKPLPDAHPIRKSLRAASLIVTVILHPHQELPEPHDSLSAETDERGSAEAYTRILEKYGASETDIAKIHAFAEEFDLIVMETNKGARSVKLTGATPQIEQAFHVDLYDYELPNGDYRGRTGGIFLPVSLVAIVSGVFGLDDRPIGKAHLQQREEACPPAKWDFTARQAAQRYRFPAERQGEGQTIALVEFNARRNGALRGTGYSQTDLTLYFDALGIAEPQVRSALIDGGVNDPGIDPCTDMQVLLDIQIVSAAAPKAGICVYFAPNTGQGWIDVLNAILFDRIHRPSVICIGWGAPEDADVWSGQLVREMKRSFRLAAHLGVTLCCTCGKEGSGEAPMAPDCWSLSQALMPLQGSRMPAIPPEMHTDQRQSLPWPYNTERR